MNKKRIIIIILVILILFGIYMLYNTFAVSTIASNDSNNIYDIVIGEGTTITVPKGSSKTVYFHLKNTNNGNVKYAVGYNTSTNIEVKVYEDSKDKVSDIIGYTENKYIKLYLKNPTNNSNAVTITSVLGYENGGDLIIPDGITLITEVYTPPKVTTLADYITNLYTNASKNTVVNNSITYNAASNESLMNDRLGGTTTSLDGGNIRYYGASPNNYIYFNCSDYSNQTSDTCELWRIIGVFDGKVKIMRNESIGGYSWDTSSSSISSGNGINEWSQAKLMKLLNPGYTSETVGGSLYYNGSSGTCYDGQTNAKTSCDFTSTGIKNNITRNKIAKVNWNTGGFDKTEVYFNVLYSNERGTSVRSNPSDKITRTTSWTGKVALPYPSDYGYAADFTSCNATMYGYKSDECTSSNWMKPILGTDNKGWLLTPAADYDYGAWDVAPAGHLGDYRNVYNAIGVVPTLYLNSNEYRESGNGTIDNPYKLMLSNNNDKDISLASYITDLYSSADKSTVENNSITYNTAPYESLMNDRLGGTTTSLDGGNIRYYGASPNNYIYFNCETYPDTNCELWRIIGIFDGKVKIMRNESIGYLPWNTVVPYNNWSNATLMKVLNPGYETENRNNSLYYNKLSGTCSYSYATDDDCDFTSKGIKNTITKDKIAEVTWSIGGMSTANVYSNQAYALERGTTVYSGNDTTWFGKITIPYVSDFGYAADFNGCTTTLNNYNGTNILNSSVKCRTTNWMSTIMGAKSGGIISWFLTHNSSDSGSIFELSNYENYPGIYWNNTGGGTARIFPTLYLKSEETIVEGTTGTEDNPYKLNP